MSEQKTQKSAQEMLDMYYLDIRSHLLEAAAAFDRVDEAGKTDDHRLEKLRQAGQIAVSREPERAKRFLEFMSEED